MAKNGDNKNFHLYYTANDGTNKWSSYVKILNNFDYDALQKQIDDISQMAFNAAHPIGSYYIQFPKFSDPNALYNKNNVISAWSIVDFGGAFFRAEGGDFASAYGSGLQKAALPNIKGGAGSFEYPLTATGPFKGEFYNTGHSNTGSSGGRGALEFDANNCNKIYGRREEVAPENYTIRIWKRTA